MQKGVRMQYKFRGLTEDGRWVYGDYLHTDRGGKTQCKDWIYSEPHIMRSNVFDKHEVRPETVSQWTGLQDKNGKDIFEGDKVFFCGTKSDSAEAIVYFKEGRFILSLDDWSYKDIAGWRNTEVIGNKWEQGK